MVSMSLIVAPESFQQTSRRKDEIHQRFEAVRAGKTQSVGDSGCISNHEFSFEELIQIV